MEWPLYVDSDRSPTFHRSQRVSALGPRPGIETETLPTGRSPMPRSPIRQLPMTQVLRTEATGEKQGFMNAVVSASDDRILGFTMIGSEAGEVLAVVQAAMLAGLPYTKLRDAVFSHLTPWPKASARSSQASRPDQPDFQNQKPDGVVIRIGPRDRHGGRALAPHSSRRLNRRRCARGGNRGARSRSPRR